MKGALELSSRPPPSREELLLKLLALAAAWLVERSELRYRRRAWTVWTVFGLVGVPCSRG